jgi:hypothetical protein
MIGIKEENSTVIIQDKSTKGFDSDKFKKSLDKISKGRDNKNSETAQTNNGDLNDIPGDPFFLVKYRSFHNHDLDTNYCEHAHMVMDEELHKKGSANLLPQAPCAI